MLTRLKVSGFKNLVDVDVRFGPFTCVAGANGVGKSNLFDAITFLSALASDTIINAAMSVRDKGGKTADVRSLFHRVGMKHDNEMHFEAEMLIPHEGVDDLGQTAKASTTFLRYTLVLGYSDEENIRLPGTLRLLREDLDHIKLSEAGRLLKFPHSVDTWRKSAVMGRRTSPFISTEEEGGQRIVKLRQDGIKGRPKSFLAENLPRTVLSTVNATESPTTLLARREMQSWRLLQLEPSALREPDKFITPPGLGIDGAHLPATLYHIARLGPYSSQVERERSQKMIYDQIALNLSELIDDVYGINIDRDERRELLTLEVTAKDGTVYPARSLSDGTLRFLALAVLKLDTTAKGVICLEEPENGIHPARIPAMLNLLQDIATDTKRAIDSDNPLRQVIVNTHSPSVVDQVPDDTLLFAQLQNMVRGDTRFKRTSFSWLRDTWRAKAEPDVVPVATGKLLVYMNPVSAFQQYPTKYRRIVDRPEFQLHMPLFGEE